MCLLEFYSLELPIHIFSSSFLYSRLRFDYQPWYDAACPCVAGEGERIQQGTYSRRGGGGGGGRTSDIV
jgi:hypothetical protein